MTLSIIALSIAYYLDLNGLHKHYVWWFKMFSIWIINRATLGLCILFTLNALKKPPTPAPEKQPELPKEQEKPKKE